MKDDLLINIEYAVVLRTAMEQKGISVVDLAKMVGINNRAVYAWIKGEYKPSFQNYPAIGIALGQGTLNKIRRLDVKFNRYDPDVFTEREPEKEPEPVKESTSEPEQNKPEPAAPVVEQTQPAYDTATEKHTHAENPGFVVFTDRQKGIRRLVNVNAIERINIDDGNRIVVAMQNNSNHPGAIFTADDSFDSVVRMLGAKVISNEP